HHHSARLPPPSIRTHDPHQHSSTLLFFTDPATTEIYTLSLHDALRSLCLRAGPRVDAHRDRAPEQAFDRARRGRARPLRDATEGDRKSTRLNSSHVKSSYAVFCLKKKMLRELYSDAQNRVDS